MKVYELQKILQAMPYDAEVRLDDPDYPLVKNAYPGDTLTVAVDAPPVGCVLLEIDYPSIDEE